MSTEAGELVVLTVVAVVAVLVAGTGATVKVVVEELSELVGVDEDVTAVVETLVIIGPVVVQTLNAGGLLRLPSLAYISNR